MASVWCAEDLILGRTVAIKVLADRFAEDEMAVRRFRREARAAARVSTHAHVVTVYDVGDLPGEDGGPGRTFIVMEHLAGGTVADALRVGAVRRREAMRWLHEAASALDYAHERGIVHRDVKPANFLLDRSRVLHVADFGIARLTAEDTISSAGELFGTAAYLSPEQALGRDATGASDRYALAIAAFELLTGGRPFTAEHFTAQARQHIEDPPPRATDRDRTLAPGVDEVLVRGMAKVPEERYATAGEMVSSLDAALSGVPLAPARVPAASTRSLRPQRAAHGPRIGSEPRAQRSRSHVPAGAMAAPATDAGAAGSSSRSPLRPHLGQALALAALLVVVVVIGALALTGGRSPAHRPAPRTVPTLRAATATKAPVVRHHAAAPHRTTTTTTRTPTVAAPVVPTAAQLQATGHAEMMAGDYQAAISTLQQAISAAPAGSLTYAYGLYDLGRTEMLAGDPAGAVAILEKRLKIPNQTQVVRQTLNQALQASGQVPAQLQASGTTTTSSGASGTAPGHTKGHGHGSAKSTPPAPASSGGAGIAPAPGGGQGNEAGNLVAAPTAA
jgi:serine/threonine-protein kinase